MTKDEIIEYLYENNVRSDITIEQMADDLADCKTENSLEKPNNCEICEFNDRYCDESICSTCARYYSDCFTPHTERNE